jgi:hypothetical protein
MDNNINIVKSDHFNWDESTQTLTVDVNAADCMLWFEFEELPAQGKNNKWETFINLKTGQKTKDATGLRPV